MNVETFAITARGVGRKDYSKTTERSIQPFPTPTLRQDRFNITGTVILPVIPFPWVYLFGPIPLPQEDGTWEYTASTISAHFFNLSASIKTNHLICLGLVRFASLDDFGWGIIAEQSPTIFSYNRVVLTFSVGIPTQEGSVYAVYANAWPDWAGGPFEFALTSVGIYSDLTPPWMTH